MKRKLLIALLLSGLLSDQLLLGELRADSHPEDPPSVRAGIIDIEEDFPGGQERAVWKGIYNEVAFAPVLQAREELPGEFHKDFWLGNKPNLKTRARELTMYFSPLSEESGLQKFFVEVRFEPEGLVVRHSQPRSAGLRGGLRVLTKRELAAKKFYAGARSAGLVVYTPRSLGAQRRAFVLCLRDENKDQMTRSPGGRMVHADFQESPYALERIEFVVDGFAEGLLLGGRKTGAARSEILVTPNIYPSDPYYDESIEVDPAVSLDYLPVKEAQIQTEVASFPVIGGIQASVSLHLGSGYRREIVQRSLIWIKDTQQKRSLDVETLKGDRSIAPGKCYMILQTGDRLTRYTKEPPPKALGSGLKDQFFR